MVNSLGSFRTYLSQLSEYTFFKGKNYASTLSCWSCAHCFSCPSYSFTSEWPGVSSSQPSLPTRSSSSDQGQLSPPHALFLYSQNSVYQSSSFFQRFYPPNITGTAGQSFLSLHGSSLTFSPVPTSYCPFASFPPPITNHPP